MNRLSKRQILMALGALGAGAAIPSLTRAQSALDLSAGRAIGAAYLAANANLDVAALRRTLLPDGFNHEAAARLRVHVAEDFHSNRVFICSGWRLSETEAQLFALLDMVD